MPSRSSETSTDAVELDVVLDAFDRRPGAGEARHRIAVEAVVDQLLDARRVEDRDHRVDEQEFRGMRDRRGFRRMIVAHQRQHAAMARRAGDVGVPEGIAGAVDAGALAVPEREDAVMLALAEQLRLLSAPAGRRRQLLVEPWLEDDVGALQLALGFPELLVEPAERRSAVAGHEAGRVQPHAAVALALHQEHADHRLRPRQEDALLGKIELVVERHLVQRHRAVSSCEPVRLASRRRIRASAAQSLPSMAAASNEIGPAGKCATPRILPPPRRKKMAERWLLTQASCARNGERYPEGGQPASLVTSSLPPGRPASSGLGV